MIASRPRLGAAIAIVLGLLALIVATVVGWDAGWLEAVVGPPPLVRAFLVGIAVTIGVVLLARSIERMSASGDSVSGQADVALVSIRAVRLFFLAGSWRSRPPAGHSVIPAVDRRGGHRRYRRRRDVVPPAGRR